MKKLLISSFLVIAGASAYAGGNLLANGSFENGAFTDNTGENFMDLDPGSTAITGWTTVGPYDVAWGQAPNKYGLTPEDGARFLDLTGYDNTAPYAGVTQTIATTAGWTYMVMFELGCEPNNPTYSLGGPVGITAAAGADSQTFTFNPAASGNIWTTEMFDFTASSATTAISFQGEEGSAYIGLDNTSVTLVTPEPASMAALGIGTLGLLIRRRRSTK